MVLYCIIILFFEHEWIFEVFVGIVSPLCAGCMPCEHLTQRLFNFKSYGWVFVLLPVKEHSIAVAVALIFKRIPVTPYLYRECEL